MTRRARDALAGRYRLLDRVGAGGMGAVWRARDLRTGDVVAVKVLGRHDADLLLRFVREQSVRIDHPHVVAPRSWAADDDVAVLAMDLVHGGSVQALLDAHGALPPGLVAVLLDQLLQGLAAVHAAGFVHRDVKPANLLLEATGAARPVLRLADFGVAAPVDDVRLTHVPGAVGTSGYMAPEQAAGARPEPRQDLYAAGVVAAQLLTGRGPRPGAGAGLAPNLPDGVLRPLVEALTDPAPDRRPPTAAAAQAQLRGLVIPPDRSWPPVPDRLGPPPARARPWPEPWPEPWAGLATACFAGALLLCAAALYLTFA